MGRILVIVSGSICCAILGPATAGAVTPMIPPSSPQRLVAEEWVHDMNTPNQRGACELQTIKVAMGQPCATLPTQHHAKCPRFQAGAKPPYRKSEIRTVSEQVGEYTEEGPIRGFVRVNAKVKAKQLWGALGLEQVEGIWGVTYLRYGAETFVPPGDSYMSEGWHELWISDWCSTNHPRWEQRKKNSRGDKS